MPPRDVRIASEIYKTVISLLRYWPMAFAHLVNEVLYGFCYLPRDFHASVRVLHAVLLIVGIFLTLEYGVSKQLHHVCQRQSCLVRLGTHMDMVTDFVPAAFKNSLVRTFKTGGAVV